ncbi:uncharacterized protein LOC127741598 [Arachis duranensis]|uniref:Uncharacterized protein LOC127741598 n=1 Tax=Arachis duranensis TaxID=130453 RepID=A0A9C6TL48_ARADU|nr:uncharacterized protein LOC127741598 [Arachis duranensis]
MTQTVNTASWIDPILNFLEVGKLPEDEKATKMIRREAAKFGIPKVVIPDNRTQFADKKFGEFLFGLKIKQMFSSVEHPQTNSQVEATNKVILQGLRKRLDQKKGTWADELASVLWSYRTTPQSSTEETPCQLTYGVNTVIPMEVGEPSP